MRYEKENHPNGDSRVGRSLIARVNGSHSQEVKRFLFMCLSLPPRSKRRWYMRLFAWRWLLIAVQWKRELTLRAKRSPIGGPTPSLMDIKNTAPLLNIKTAGLLFWGSSMATRLQFENSNEIGVFSRLTNRWVEM